MRSDNDIDLPLAHLLEDFLLFLGALVAVHERDIHRESSKALLEILVMLGGQDSRRHQDGHLLFGAHALEGCTHGDFCFAEPDIATDEAVHGPAGFHVTHDIGGGLHLVGSRLVFKRVIEFLLHLGIGREAKAFHQLALGVQFHEFPRNLHHLLLDALLEVLPILAAELVERRNLVFGRIQAVNLLQVGYGELEAVATRIFQEGAVHPTAVHVHAHKSQVAPDAVILVGHVVPA